MSTANVSAAIVTATPSPTTGHWALAVLVALLAHAAVLLTQVHWPEQVQAPSVEPSATFLPAARLPQAQRLEAAIPPSAQTNSAQTSAVAATQAAVPATVQTSTTVTSEVTATATPVVTPAPVATAVNAATTVPVAASTTSTVTIEATISPTVEPATSVELTRPTAQPVTPSVALAIEQPTVAASVPAQPAAAAGATATVDAAIATAVTPNQAVALPTPAVVPTPLPAPAVAVATNPAEIAPAPATIAQAAQSVTPATPQAAIVAQAVAPTQQASEVAETAPPTVAQSVEIETALALPTPEIPPVLPAEPDVDVDAEIAARVESFLADESCARLGSTPDLAVADERRIEGIVTSDTSLARLAGELASVEGAPAVELAVQVVDVPFCQALLALPIAVEGVDSMELNNDDGLYLDGELLALQIGPVPVGGELYVAFVDHDGSVQHLMPSQFEQTTSINAGDIRELGVEQDILDVLEALGISIGNWRATEPFGRGLIMAFITGRQLNPAPTEGVTNSEAYFGYLGEVTADNPVLWARYRWIDTSPGN